MGRVAGHVVGVDLERELVAGVADLSLRGDGVGAERGEDRREGVPQLVRREALGERAAAFGDQQLVGGFEDGLDDAVADVVLVADAAGAGWEDVVVGVGVVAAGPVVGQGGLEDRDEVDGADAGLRLGSRDPQLAVGQVHVAPSEQAQLVGAEAGEDSVAIDGSRPAMR